MSTHCSKYPDCGCPEDIGTKCGIEEAEEKIIEAPSETKKLSKHEEEVAEQRRIFYEEKSRLESKVKDLNYTSKRTGLLKGKMAPKGYTYISVKIKAKGMVYGSFRTIQNDFKGDNERLVVLQLLEGLMDKYKIRGWS